MVSSGVASNSIFTILLLALLGFVVGSLLAKTAKLKKGAAPSDEQVRQQPDKETLRQLTQLKQQLRSGLITKEEYQEKERLLLKE